MPDVAFLTEAQVYALIFHVLMVPPMWRLYRRVGLDPWWSLLALVPVVGLALVLAPLAVKRWPAAPRALGSGDRLPARRR